MEKLLTIVISTYNMEKYLDKCLTSLIIKDKELMKKVEVFVIIDAATDRSAEIAHTYESRFPDTYRVIEKDNGHIGSCVNRGLKEATGKYIKVLDADDYYDTVEYEKFLYFLQSIDVDMILTPFHYVNEDYQLTTPVKYDLPESANLTFKEVTPALLKQSIQMHAVAYKTENLRAIHYTQTEKIAYSDQEWVFTPLSTVNKIAYFNHSVYRYLYGRVGQTMNADALKRNVGHNVMCAKKILRDYLSFEKFDEHKQAIIDHKAFDTLECPYRLYLLSYPDLPQEGLVEFDNFVHQLSPSLYSKTNGILLKYTKCRYIESWHKDTTYKIPNYVRRYVNITGKIHGKLKRLGLCK